VTRIDFHVNVAHRVHHACRVTRKARAGGQRLVVYARSTERLAQYDSTLWTFSALDFLPHVYVDSPLAADTPILLTSSLPAAPASDVLLTLDDELTDEFVQQIERYGRVIEVVSTDEQDRARARVRFKAYREHGYQPSTFPVAQGEEPR
jgi:DNA polymerase III subunit chi